MTRTTLEAVCAALAFVSPLLPRDEWARVGMAIKDFDDGARGFELFDQWSSGGETYNAKGTRDTWKSIKAGGAVGIGTLFHLAKASGYEPAQAAPAPTPTPARAAVDAKANADRRRKNEAEAQQYRERADRTARDAEARWADASDEGSSSYLTRKGVKGWGVRYLPDGTLVVPLRDAAGTLQNLQLIAPRKPAGGAPEKRFLPGGRKTGLFHWCGDPAGAPVLLIAEGLATASTAHEATGLPAAMGIDAGNLVHVAKAIREHHPDALIVLVADNDHDTETRTGRNPGIEGAKKAARAVGGVIVWADAKALPEGGSDMNDLAAHAGLDAVRDLVESAIKAGPQPVPKRAPGPAPAPGAAEPPMAAPGPGDGVFDPFTVNDAGVFFQGFDQQGKPRSPMRICGRLEAVARTRSSRGDAWGYLLVFTDAEGRPKELALTAEDLQGDGVVYRKRMAYMGLDIETSRTAREKLPQYIRSRCIAAYARAVDRAGWHGRVFVLPGKVIGEVDERYIIQSEAAHEHPFSERGTLQNWQQAVARPAVGNSRLIFGLAVAFAGPLIRLAESKSVIFHLKGPSSRGKSTVQEAAGSVYGSPSIKHPWDGTKTGMENLGAIHSDSLLLLDDLKNCDPKTVGDTVYMLGNGQGRVRGRSTAGLRPTLTWLTVVLSSGEVTLEQHMAAAGLRPAEGQEVRMPTIPAEPDGLRGTMYETHHEFADGAVLSDHIKRAVARYHGVAGIEFLRWVAEHFDEVRRRLAADIAQFVADHVSLGADGQVKRVASSFALVSAAGELATEAGITGWKSGEAGWGVRQCFRSWLAARVGGEGSGERAHMLRAVRLFLERHAEDQFKWWHRALDDRAPNAQNRAGFRRMIDADGKPIKTNSDHQRAFGETMHPDDGVQTTVEYYIFSEVFRTEICKGFDYQAVARALREGGHLKTDGEGRFDYKARLPGVGEVRCYRIKPSIFEVEL